MAFTFDPDIVLAAIRECVTVVKPGEVLAVRVPGDVDEDAADRLRTDTERIRELHDVRVVFLRGEEFGRVVPWSVGLDREFGTWLDRQARIQGHRPPGRRA